MLRTSSLLLASSLLFAQQPAPRAPTFHLPAGDYSIGELLQQASQAVGRPIVATAIDDGASAPRLRLQCGLAMPQADWSDVLGALLSTRGVVLSKNGNGDLEALPAPSGMEAWIEERAETITAQQLFERSCTGPVRLVIEGEVPKEILINALRPFLATYDLPVRHAAGEDGVVLIGLAEPVRFATRQASRVVPALAAAMPAPAAWPRAGGDVVHRLEAGRYTCAQLVDALATALHRNIVLDEGVGALRDPVDVGESVAGNDLVFEEQLTALLWTKNVLVEPVASRHGLHEAVLLEPGNFTARSRLVAVLPAELLARPQWVAWVSTAAESGKLTRHDLIGVFRGFAAKGRDTTSLVLGATRDGVSVTGLSRHVVPVLESLEQLRSQR